MKHNVAIPVPQIMENIVEVIQLVLLFAKHFVTVPVPQIMETFVEMTPKAMTRSGTR